MECAIFGMVEKRYPFQSDPKVLVTTVLRLGTFQIPIIRILPTIGFCNG